MIRPMTHQKKLPILSMKTPLQKPWKRMQIFRKKPPRKQRSKLQKRLFPAKKSPGWRQKLLLKQEKSAVPEHRPHMPELLIPERLPAL